MKFRLNVTMLEDRTNPTDLLGGVSAPPPPFPIDPLAPPAQQLPIDPLPPAPPGQTPIIPPAPPFPGG